MPHFFFETTTGDKVVVLADSAAQAEARAIVAGFAAPARPPYRVEAFALRPYVGAFHLVLPPDSGPSAGVARCVSGGPG